MPATRPSRTAIHLDGTQRTARMPDDTFGTQSRTAGHRVQENRVGRQSQAWQS